MHMRTVIIRTIRDQQQRASDVFRSGHQQMVGVCANLSCCEGRSYTVAHCHHRVDRSEAHHLQLQRVLHAL
jgi:hypothetical protein